MGQEWRAGLQRSPGLGERAINLRECEHWFESANLAQTATTPANPADNPAATPATPGHTASPSKSASLASWQVGIAVEVLGWMVGGSLGGALAFAQILKPGVYIAMNGRVFDWDKVTKNKETGVFEQLS